MCGIALCAHIGYLTDGTTEHVNVEQKVPVPVDQRNVLLNRRGPDAYGKAEIYNEKVLLAIVEGSVLHMRGYNVTKQPIFASNGDFICWNGELYDWIRREEADDVNDGVVLLQLLRDCDGHVERIKELLYGKLRGPFALFYWHDRSSTLFIARDKLGRRSLVVNYDEKNSLLRVASVAIENEQVNDAEPLEWKELPVSGFFSLSFRKNSYQGILQFYPWDDSVYEKSSSSGLLDIFNIPAVERCPFTYKRRRCLAPVETFLKFLSESIRKRVSCLHRDLELNAHSNARIAILFSGGIDSLIIAALADKFIPEDESIDLVNVAFGLNPYNAPDRQTGINAFLELRRLNSAAGRWRFVEVNLNLEDIEASRSRVCELLNPQNTVMDFNIGSVLWHAARAFGRVCNGDLYQEIFSTRTRYAGASLDSKVELSDINSNYSISDGKFSTYVSPAKVLLSGLGADELLSGYGRHRTAFRKGGFAALEEELDKDISRIWRRNLGRDDRLMSDHSREVRFPFLDEDFVQFIRSTDLNDLVDLKEPAGVGDKKILRDAAISIGIRREYASLEKRAIQFGTKIANKNVAGYVRLSDQIRTSEMVQSEEKAQLSENLSKKVNKKKGKPGFE